MTSPYESGFVKNVFQQLDTECSLYVLGICLASNDIVRRMGKNAFLLPIKPAYNHDG